MSEILVYTAPVLVAMILSSPFWFLAHKRHYFLWWEILGPFTAQICWFAVYWTLQTAMIGSGKTLANLIEVIFLVPALSVVSAVVKIFIFSKFGLSHRNAAVAYLLVNILGAALIAVAVPTLPE